MRHRLPTLAASLMLAACAAAPTVPDQLAREVFESERAFARAMAERDADAFASFLADEAVFFSGPNPVRGKRAVAADWQRFFEGPHAPFSWEPVQVQVLDSGTLALSTGPVRDPSGAVVSTFTSIWRREAPGVWRVVFDKGCPVCAAREAPRPGEKAS